MYRMEGHLSPVSTGRHLVGVRPEMASPMPAHLPAVYRPSSTAFMETCISIALGACQQNTSMIPGTCQPRARIGMAGYATILAVQSTSTGSGSWGSDADAS